MIHKKRDAFSESKGVLTHSIHIYRDDKLELHPWTVRNSRHVKSELMGQLTSLVRNKARGGHICPPVQKWQNIAYLGGKSPHVNISKYKYVHDGHFDNL